MHEPIENVEHDGHIIKIHLDDLIESPREWDNLGTMVCFHRSYSLGDVQPKSSYAEYLTELAMEIDPALPDKIHYWENGKGWAHLNNISDDPCKASDAHVSNLVADILEKNTVWVDVSLLDHSGLSMYVGSGAHWCDSGGWDSGPIGFIYVTHDKIKKEFGWKHLTKKRLDKIRQYLVSEITTYDQYLRGDVYGYVITKEHEDGEVEDRDSCWGFYGIDSCMQEAQSVVDSYRKVDFPLIEEVQHA